MDQTAEQRVKWQKLRQPTALVGSGNKRGQGVFFSFISFSPAPVDRNKAKARLCPGPRVTLQCHAQLWHRSALHGMGIVNKHLNWVRTQLVNTRKVWSIRKLLCLLKSSLWQGCFPCGQIPHKNCTQSQSCSVQVFWSLRSQITWNNPILSAGNLGIAWKMYEFLYPLPPEQPLAGNANCGTEKNIKTRKGLSTNPARYWPRTSGSKKDKMTGNKIWQS